MFILLGNSALPDFHLARLEARAHHLRLEITNLRSYFLYFVTTSAHLDEVDKRRLLKMLSVDSEELILPQHQLKFVVTPRIGMISSWSSKVDALLGHCQLLKVKRIERAVLYLCDTAQQPDLGCQQKLESLFYDRMVEQIFTDFDTAITAHSKKTQSMPLGYIDLQDDAKHVLAKENADMGLAFSKSELAYLEDMWQALGRNPTDVELMMFGQINSEHCRHKYFNAKDWRINGVEQSDSLFSMIRQTYKADNALIRSAYSDNGAVIQGFSNQRFFADSDRHYNTHKETNGIVIKVETHNHPTAIAPYSGAATGVGGEIRDEAATGRGAKPKVGLTGFAVSNLRIPDFVQVWEQALPRPAYFSNALSIMLEAPIGAANYSNEFGRPVLAGYFRTYERHFSTHIIAYHKPIMLAGGYGVIDSAHIKKQSLSAGDCLLVLGSPCMAIGVGGGSASSMTAGSNDTDLDFGSVQRDNAEMQRRCQGVIDSCWSLGADNPILSIHDVGAGGLANAIPELIHDSHKGATLKLFAIPQAESIMSPMQIWCNETQERYVLAIKRERLHQFHEMCQRERTPYAVIAHVTDAEILKLTDDRGRHCVDLSVPTLFMPMTTSAPHVGGADTNMSDDIPADIDLKQAIYRVLRLPSVASKEFLITIGDRSVGGLVVRDQMVGPWQVPVADCAVSSASYAEYVGEAVAIGERPPIALLNAPASGRMAVAEAIMNISAARILRLQDIALSANWMAASRTLQQDSDLWHTVVAVRDLCLFLEMAIPVGKDSLHMQAKWREDEQDYAAISPLSLNISAFARVADVRQSLTPQLQRDTQTCLLFIDLAPEKMRLGGSALLQVYSRIGDDPPDLDEPKYLRAFFQALQLLNDHGYIIAYHDRSDGGLLVTLLEMAFAGRVGLDIDLPQGALIDYLFNEELGAVIQIKAKYQNEVRQQFIDLGLPDNAVVHIGQLNESLKFNISKDNHCVFTDDLLTLQQAWSETSYRMQSLRDHPDCAKQAYHSLADTDDPGLFLESQDQNTGLFIRPKIRPKLAILREQGINGHVEMAAAFDRAGFDCVDVHMQDLLDNEDKLENYCGLAVCGGFSYGDVLGAGSAWAKTILYNERLSEQFYTFFHTDDTFTLGVCNGCQMLSQLRSLIPGTDHWPEFSINQSQQFESRLVMVEIMSSPSVLLANMQGMKLPVVVAHAEGRVVCSQNLPDAALRYVDHYGHATEIYPRNPNGSSGGLTGFSSEDGLCTIMMPHPERVFLSKQFSWRPPQLQDPDSPWMQMFINARIWVD